MDADNYRRFTLTRGIEQSYRWQAPATLRYSDFRTASFNAVCRDPFASWFHSIRSDDWIGKRIEGKAKLVLAAVDAKNPANLRCECGRVDRLPK